MTARKLIALAKQMVKESPKVLPYFSNKRKRVVEVKVWYSDGSSETVCQTGPFKDRS